ncbi:SAGA-associated factor 29 [Hondaea fermentalgiana]|uniref:SAGA-associated factor 29 n=1 Tax=Hondaea fermentalgiana TaxID=2315210 RepID=A0A2R5GBN8_9STRA|nr:SAGA-associated factor 29 [Hondaea fermentalgiana]|eukprot:GBG28387.1 SAGA-associated factor 29 [Hondaea fermentalgiana]
MAPHGSDSYGQDGKGSVLEEYLDMLQVMPVEIRRYTTLMRDLDQKCTKEVHRLAALQGTLVERAREQCANETTPEGRAQVVKKLRESDEFKPLVTMRASLKQKIAEKRSISDQLFDMSEQNLKRLRSDIDYLKDILQLSGEIQESPYTPGRLVAAYIEADATWIVCKVSEFSQANPDLVTVADVDDSKTRYVLPVTKVVLLADKETLNTAKVRLSSRGKKVLAVYPKTTCFYKATLVSTPFRESGNGPSAMPHPPGTILCGVQFDDDDVDQATGSTMKHFVPTKYVFAQQQ